MESSDELTPEHTGSDKEPADESIDEAAVIAVLRNGPVEARVDAADLLSGAETSEALSALMDGLKDPELAVRIACMESLGSARAVSAIPLLLDGFSDADPRIRKAAASAFWSFGRNSPEPDVMVAIQEAVPFLTNALRDPDEQVRVDAAGALGCTRSLLSVPALYGALRDPCAEVRRYVVWALGRIADADSIPVLVEVLLSDAAPIVRRNAAVAISTIASEGKIESRIAVHQTTSSVILALRDEHEKVRQNAAHALASLPSQLAVDQVVRILSDEHSDVRHYGAWALGEMSAVDGINGKVIDFSVAVQRLGSLLSDPEEGVRRFAVWALGKIARKDATPVTVAGMQLILPKIASLLRDPNSRVRNNAAWALSFASSEIVVPSLIAALDDTEADVRGNAAYALGCIGSIYVIPALVETLSDEDETVRASSSKSLCYLASLRDGKSLSFEIALKMAVPAVIKALEDDATEVRTNIISFLEQIQSQDAVPRLVKLLRDPVADVRARAASALGEMEARNAVPQLIAALRDEASVVRRASLLALADIGDVSCFPALRRLLSDEDPEVRHDARIAILRLPLPPNRNAGIASDENDNINSGDESTRRNDDDRCGVDDFNWSFRPETYWISHRQRPGDAFENTPQEPNAEESRSASDRLPPLKDGEVEIALIRIRSSIGRLLSLRASRGEDDIIVYRIVDETSMSTILSPSEKSGVPLTFREVTRLLLHPVHSTGAPVLRLLAREHGLSAIELYSDFYAQLNVWWRRSVSFWQRNDPDR